MFQLIKQHGSQHALLRHAPQLALSTLLVEQFCKFGSFSLECLAFLAFWFTTDAIVGSFIKTDKNPIS